MSIEIWLVDIRSQEDISIRKETILRPQPNHQLVDISIMLVELLGYLRIICGGEIVLC